MKIMTCIHYLCLQKKTWVVLVVKVLAELIVLQIVILAEKWMSVVSSTWLISRGNFLSITNRKILKTLWNLLETYLYRKNVCCGVIFVGMMGEVLIEPSLLKPCLGCLARQQRQQLAAAATTLPNSSPSHSSASASPCHSSASTSPAHSVESGTEGKPTNGKGFSDSSSDSGYDEFNQGLINENKIKCQTLLDKPGKIKKQIIDNSLRWIGRF